MDKNCEKPGIKKYKALVLLLLIILFFPQNNLCLAFNNNLLINLYSKIHSSNSVILNKLWISKRYELAKINPASSDIDLLLDLSVEVMNKPLRQRFNREIYESILYGPIKISDMTDDQIINAIKYEKGNWSFHCNYIVNPPKKWHIVIDARPYINDITNQSCVVFYLTNFLYCDTFPCSICGDGSRYWSLKKEAIKRNINTP